MTNSLAFPNMFNVANNCVGVLEDNISIVNRTRLLILTEPTELYNNPDFGVGLKRHLWQYNTENEKAIIRDRIVGQLSKYEPCCDAEETQFADGLLFSGGDELSTQEYNQLKMTIALKTIFGDTLEIENIANTSIPVNSVYVTPHTPEGYIDVVYFSDEIPKDASIEYVRPLGMFLFQHAGVRFDARTKITIDARLTDERDLGLSDFFGPTQVGHYRREDYARLQKTAEIQADIEDRKSPNGRTNDTSHTRKPVWFRNSDFEDKTYGDGTYESGAGKATVPEINPGYRALYSLQISNNEEIVRSLVGPIFDLGYEPQVEVVRGPQYVKDDYMQEKAWNLRYDRKLDEAGTAKNAYGEYDVSVLDSERTDGTSRIPLPIPAVNPIMSTIGDAISLNDSNTKYTKADASTGEISVVDPE